MKHFSCELCNKTNIELEKAESDDELEIRGTRSEAVIIYNFFAENFSLLETESSLNRCIMSFSLNIAPFRRVEVVELIISYTFISNWVINFTFCEFYFHLRFHFFPLALMAQNTLDSLLKKGNLITKVFSSLEEFFRYNWAVEKVCTRCFKNMLCVLLQQRRKKLLLECSSINFREEFYL